MRKIKATVNRILIFAWAASAVYGQKKSAYLMAEYSAGKFKVITRHNDTMMAPVGSLLKPFAAWYLLEKGVNPDTTILCPPERKRTEKLRCWIPAGHGATSLQAALAQSCNYYFLSRFLGLNLAEYETWLRQRFDWPVEISITKPQHVYGFDLTRGIEPEKLLAMYSTLLYADEKQNSHAKIVMDGIRQTCQGTLVDFCHKLLQNKKFRFLAGKTGSVIEGKRNFGIALLYLEHVSDRKKILLLCYEKNKMGSQAAMNAFQVLNAYNRKETN